MRAARTVSTPNLRQGDGISSPHRVPRSKAEPLCAHCELPIPGSRAGTDFCCAGCETVYGLLHDAGLTRFYELGGARRTPVGAVPRVHEFDWLPDLERRAGGGNVIRLTLDVQGVRCAACVWVLQELWRRRQGALDMRLDPSVGQVALTYDRSRLDLAEYLTRAAELGYAMAPARKSDRGRDRGLLIRLGICAALAGNAMLLALSLYLGLEAEGGVLVEVFRTVSFGLSTASVLVGGPVFFRGALAGLRQRVLHLDLPISLGILLAWAGSVHGLISGGAVYFDTITVFVALMLAGRYVQASALERNRRLLLADDGVEHIRARRIDRKGVARVPVAELRAGEELLLAPGDLVPVRVALAEQGAFSLDWIAGESEPRSFAAGAEVPAGAFHCGRQAARVVAVSDFAGSGLPELLRQPTVGAEDLRGRHRFWSALNRFYVLAVLALAVIGGALWSWLDPARALPVAVSILVVTCPCALGLATPLAFHLALGRLRRRGVFVRSSALLEKARHVRTVLFDKTGTVTWGGVRVGDAAPTAGEDRIVLETMVASSGHPVSQAIARHHGEPRGFRPDLRVTEVPGSGLECRDGERVYRLGSPRFAGGRADRKVDGDGRACVFTRDGVVLARFPIEEDYRDGAAGEVGALQAAGLDVHLISGDRPERVARAAARLGIGAGRWRGGMSPAEKAGYVTRLDRADTLMVGDGINDAPAFEAAFCSGTPALDRPVMPARADFYFVGNRSGAVLAVLNQADRLHGAVRTNLLMAAVYNAGALTLCFLGVMTPLLCAVLMPLSSVALLTHTTARWRS